MRYGKRPSRKGLIAGGVSVGFASLAISFVNMSTYRQGTNQRWEPVAFERNAIYASSPVALRNGVVFNSIRNGRYSLAWLHNGQIDPFFLDGHAFQPSAVTDPDSVRFELVSHGKTNALVLNTASGSIRPETASPVTVSKLKDLSPDGKWLAFTRSDFGSTQVCVRSRDGRTTIQLTGGACNSFDPVWELDSKAVIFASDCGRGLGLPKLFRAPLSQIVQLREGL